MKKLLAIVDDNPELKEICTRINERGLFFNRRVEEISKALDAANADYHNAGKDDWAAIEVLLKTKLDALKYDKKVHGLHVSKDMEAVYFETNTPPDNFSKFLRDLFDNNN